MSLLASCSHEHDPRVAAECVAALRTILTPPSNVDGDRDLALLMAGAEDDHASLRRLDEMRVEVQQAINPTPVPQRANQDF